MGENHVTKEHERVLREIITKNIKCKLVSFTYSYRMWELVIEVPDSLNILELKAFWSVFTFRRVDFEKRQVTLFADESLLAHSIEYANYSD